MIIGKFKYMSKVFFVYFIPLKNTVFKINFKYTWNRLLSVKFSWLETSNESLNKTEGI